MNSLGRFNVSALIAVAMVAGIILVLVPETSLTTVVLTTGAAFALAAGFVFFIPSFIKKIRTGSNANQVATIGPVFLISLWLLLITGTSFILSVYEFPKLAWAALIFATGTFIICWQVLNASANSIDEVASSSSNTSNHVVWQGQLTSLSSISSNKDSRATLQRLSEKIRYSASDVYGGAPQDSQISDAVADISNAIASQNDIDISGIASNIEILVAQREVFLRSARGKA